jgi:hypothetical protein
VRGTFLSQLGLPAMVCGWQYRGNLVVDRAPVLGTCCMSFRKSSSNASEPEPLASCRSLFSLLLLSIGLLRLPVYCLQIETLSTGAGFGRQWWKNFPLSMEEFPLHGGRNSPPMVEGFTALSWKEIGGRGRISPVNVEEIPRYGGRISPLPNAFVLVHCLQMEPGSAFLCPSVNHFIVRSD